MPLKVARRGRVPPFMVMDVLRSANEMEASGRDVLHLELGQPVTSAPLGVIRAAEDTLKSSKLGYTEALGEPSLRREISNWYKRRYQVDVPHHRIVITTGSSAAFVLAFLSAFEADDSVIVANPSYPAYRNILGALGLNAIGVTAGPSARFQLGSGSLDQFQETISGLIIASPANPTGAIIRESDLKSLSISCCERGVRLISDEIYHGICFDEKEQTALKFDENAIVVGSFSKYFSMTGWRVGWMVVPDNLLRSVECLAQNLYISPPTLSQIAAIAAFNCTDELDSNVAGYAKSRLFLIDNLGKMGFGQIAPVDGAFYVYADVSGFCSDSAKFCSRLLDETGVAIAPGMDFDPVDGHRYVRVSFSGEFDHIVKAVDRMGNWLSGLKN